MSGLLDLQRRFQAHMLGEAPASPVPIVGTREASAEDRLRIYAEGIGLRFLEVLGEDYPGLRGLLGGDDFRILARAYAAAHPSRHPSIRWFGRHLPAFLGGAGPWRDRPMLAEMAAFEWAKGELVDAPDSPVVGVADIAAIAPDAWAAIRPRIGPATRRLTLGFNVPALWSAIEAGDTPPPPARLEPAAEWLLWRQDIDIRWRSIEPDEAWALGACAAGEDFGGICAGLCARVGEDTAALRGATFLKQWATDGLLAAV